MEDRIIQFRMGVMVAATVLITLILVTLFGRTPWSTHKTYTVHIRFPEARGVTPDTPVRKNGILIGRVSKVAFAPEDGVIISAELNDDIVLRANEVARLASGLLGDSELQFAGVAQAAEGESKPGVIQPGAVLQGQVNGNPLNALNDIQPQLDRVVVSMTGAGDEVQKLAKNLNRLLVNNDEQLNRIVRKTEITIDLLQHTLKNVDDVVGDTELRDNFKRTLSGMPKALNDFSLAIADIQTTAQTANRNLKNLEGFTEPLGKNGEQMLTRVSSTVERLDALMEQMVLFGRTLNNRDSTFGKLLNDTATYDQVNQTLAQVQELLREARPVVDNARVFAQKIAQHPELLGVRGAIKPSTGIKSSETYGSRISHTLENGDRPQSVIRLSDE